MTEPLSIASGSVAIIKTAYDISLLLYKFLQDVKKVDQRVVDLRAEVNRLCRLLESITAAVKSPSIQSASTLTPEHVELLGSVDDVLASCQVTVDSLSDVLQGVVKGSQSKSLFSRSKRAIRLNMDSGEIDGFRFEIYKCCVELQLALQTINLIVSCLSPDRVIGHIVPKIEELTRIVTAVNTARLPHSASQTDHKIVNSKIDASGERLRRSAKTILSSARTVVEESSTVWGGSERNYLAGSVNEEPLTRETSDQIRKWIAERRIEEEASDSISLKSIQKFSLVTITTEDESQSSEGPQELSAPVNATSPGDAGSHLDNATSAYDSEDEIEFEVTEKLLQKFSLLCSEGNVNQAEPILQHALKRANGLSLRKRELLEIENAKLDLVKAYLENCSLLCGDGKATEAEQALHRALQASGKLHSTQRELLDVESAKLSLAKAFLHNFSQLCGDRNPAEAEKLLRQISDFTKSLQLKSRNEIDLKDAELALAKAFLREESLEKSEQILISLTHQEAESEYDAVHIVSATHTLAQVYTLELKFRDARDACEKAMKARRRLLGKDHHDYFQSLNLMVNICKADSDDITAMAYAELLPDWWENNINIDDETERKLRDSAGLKKKRAPSLFLRNGSYTIEGHTGGVHAVAFSPDGRLVASTSSDSTVRLWDTATGFARRTLEGHTDWVWGVAFSPDGRLLASASTDGTVMLWDATTGVTRRTIECHMSSAGVAFSPDGRLVASAPNDGTVRLWDTATGAVRHTLQGHTDAVLAVDFSPDGRLLASASTDGTVRLWDTTTGVTRRTLKDHMSSVGGVAFSPDGSLVASGSGNPSSGTVRLWDAATGAVRHTLEGHTYSIWGVAFSPDGRLVASASGDGTVRLWDTATGAVRRTLNADTGSVWGVAFSPNGRLVASASMDGTVRLWDI